MEIVKITIALHVLFFELIEYDFLTVKNTHKINNSWFLKTFLPGSARNRFSITTIYRRPHRYKLNSSLNPTIQTFRPQQWLTTVRNLCFGFLSGFLGFFRFLMFPPRIILSVWVRSTNWNVYISPAPLSMSIFRTRLIFKTRPTLKMFFPLFSPIWYGFFFFFLFVSFISPVSLFVMIVYVSTRELINSPGKFVVYIPRLHGHDVDT